MANSLRPWSFLSGFNGWPGLQFGDASDTRSNQGIGNARMGMVNDLTNPVRAVFFEELDSHELE